MKNMKNKNLYYILGGVLVIGVVALVAMQLRGSSSLQGNLGALPGMPPRSNVGTTKPNTLTPNPVDSSPNVVADLRKPPVVYIITNPLPSGQAQPGDKFTVATLIDQGDLVLDHVEVYVNEKMVRTEKLKPFSELTYTYVVDLTALADGTYSLGVKAYDNVGHNAEKKIAFTVKHPVALPVTPPHLTVTLPDMKLADIKGQPKQVIKVAKNKLDFSVNLDTYGIDAVNYYVDADKNPGPIASPVDPKLFNWTSHVFEWGNHDGMKTPIWHIYPKAFASNPFGLTFDPYEYPTPLECFPNPEDNSCFHTVKIEGLSKGNVLFTKEINVEVVGSSWELSQAAAANNSIYIEVQSIKDIK